MKLFFKQSQRGTEAINRGAGSILDLFLAIWNPLGGLGFSNENTEEIKVFLCKNRRNKGFAFNM